MSDAIQGHNRTWPSGFSASAGVFELRARLVDAINQRDAARQALRNLVDATSWYVDEKSGHIAVNEGAMDVAMGLVVAWSKGQGKDDSDRANDYGG